MAVSTRAISPNTQANVGRLHSRGAQGEALEGVDVDRASDRNPAQAADPGTDIFADNAHAQEVVSPEQEDLAGETEDFSSLQESVEGLSYALSVQYAQKIEDSFDVLCRHWKHALTEFLHQGNLGHVLISLSIKLNVSHFLLSKQARLIIPLASHAFMYQLIWYKASQPGDE